jgi:hypothetical protein
MDVAPHPHTGLQTVIDTINEYPANDGVALDR